MERATLIPVAGPSPRPAGTLRRIRTSALLRHAADGVVVWLERQRQRRALLRLDDRMLRDIGASRVEVIRECDKPFWRP